MAAKTIFLCETNHADQAMRIAESLVVKKLSKFGYNQLYMEWDSSEVARLYLLFAKSYQTFTSISYTQIFRLFDLSKKCLSDESSVSPSGEMINIAFEAVQSGLRVGGFEGASRNANSENTARMCEILADKHILGSLIFLILRNKLKKIDPFHDKVNDARDSEIIDNLAKLHKDALEPDKNIIITGIDHCVDFYNYANKQEILDEFIFIQIRSNLITYFNPNLGDTVSLENDKSKKEFGLAYTCGELAPAIEENLEYFGVDLLDLDPDADEDLLCEAKFNDYMQGQTKVIHCDINVNDLGNYQDCLHNVTRMVTGT